MIVSVTDEKRNLVEKYIEKNKPVYPVVIESRDSGTTFGLQGGYPTKYLIGPDGRIAWAGNFFEETQTGRLLEQLLAKSRSAPDLPAALAPVESLFARRKFGEARNALAKFLAGEKVAEADRAAAEEAAKWIDDSATFALQTAEADAIHGEVAKAALAYEGVAAEYAGIEAGAKAAEALKAILADPAKKLEVEGAKALSKAQDKAADLDPKKQIPLFKAIVSKYGGTKAAARAQEILSELERKVK